MEVGRIGRWCRRGGGRGSGGARSTPSQLVHARGRPRPAASTAGRSRRAERLSRKGVEPARAGKPPELDVSALVEFDVVVVDDRIAHHFADQNLASVRLARHACRHRDVAAEQIVTAAYRLAHVDSDPDTNTVGPLPK